MTTQFSIKGVDEALRKLRTLGPKLQQRGLAASLRKGAGIARRAAVARAKQFDRPGTPEKVYAEIVVRTNARRGRQVGGAVVQIGVKGGAKSYKNNKQNRRLGRVGGSYEGPGKLWYWRLLEFGTSKMRAQPFMRPALANNIQPITDAIVQELNKQIDTLTAKGGG